MTKSVAYCLLIAFSAVCIMLSVAEPSVLGDKNGFLREFVNHEFLNVLGVILAITLASASQLHLTLNQIEEKYKKRGFTRARAGIRQAAYWLIGLFLLGILLVIVKPLLGDPDWSSSLFNGAALIILLWNVLVLLGLTQAVFAIEPHIPEE